MMVMVFSIILKLMGNPEMSTSYGFLLKQTHNPKVAGSNPAPATKNIKDLHRFGVSPFSLWATFWALFLVIFFE